MLQTEYEFKLPKGYMDESGDLHTKGRMRLATAADEILPLKDPRVKNNPSYLTVIVLSRVVTELGSVKSINPHTIESLFVEDLNYLQELYRRVNNSEEISVTTPCPHCNEKVEVGFTPGEW